MEYEKQLEEYFVHLLRIALGGSAQEIVALGRRVARSVRMKAPEFSGQLVDLLNHSAANGTKAALRRTSQAVVPVDRESRLDLLLIEDPVALVEKPILPVQVLEEIEQLLSEHRQATSLIEIGLEPSNTLLLVGPPGVGKTYTARWIAASLNKPLYTLNLASVMSSFLGRTGNNLNAVIAFAKNSPGVLFLDEIDAIAKKRDDVSEVGELKRLVTVLLQEIDNWPKDRLLIAATNHAKLLDPAVWRRFSIVSYLTPPNVDQLHRFLSDELGGIANERIVSALEIALSGRTLSDINLVINNSKKRAFLLNLPIDEVLLREIKIYAKSLDKSGARTLTTKLAQAGLSQRRVSEITGIARDTIRKVEAEARDG